MKKGKYWFSKLSHKQKRELKNELLRYWAAAPDPQWFVAQTLKNEYESFKSFLYKSISFSDTKSGFDYWYNVALKKVK